MAWVGCTHHVLRIKHLLCQLWDCQRAVLLRTTRREGRKACHEEVKPREGNQIYSDLAQVAIQLTWEAKAARHATHGCTHEMVQVTVSWSRGFKRYEEDKK
jgi:hypothetical protein